MISVKLPACLEVSCELLIFKVSAQQFDRHEVLVQDGVMKFAVGHLIRVDKFLMQGAKLQSSEEVGAL